MRLEDFFCPRNSPHKIAVEHFGGGSVTFSQLHELSTKISTVIYISLYFLGRPTLGDERGEVIMER